MHIGLDAKRAFLNKTGLGNYSRMIIDLLAGEGYQMSLFTPERSPRLDWEIPVNSKIISPGIKSPVWRSWGISNLLKKSNIDIYHGLSHELPFNIDSFSGAKVVSMHDCIFRHFPKSYSWIDRNIYNLKWKNALHKADKVIAISKSTADDLIRFYNVESKKIEVIHLFTSSSFHPHHNREKVEQTLRRYSIRKPYFLFVGNHHPRKNMDLVIRAYAKASKEIPPILLLGGNTRLMRSFVKKQGLAEKILIPDQYVTQEELSHLYQEANALIYPSLYEGFGLPVLEAMQSGCPVITCKNSSLMEVGSDAVLYTDENDEQELIELLITLSESDKAIAEFRSKGLQRARHFSASKHKDQLLGLYEYLIG